MAESQNKPHDDGTNVGVNARTNENKVLALLKQDRKLTSKTLASTFGLSDRQAGTPIINTLYASRK